MAKKSMVERELKRQRMVAKFAAKRTLSEALGWVAAGLGSATTATATATLVA